jgi:hypothetical protein
MKKNLLLLTVLLTALFSSAQAPTDLFFSEYVEGSGNNKALEIYNPTSQPIDLNNYYVARYSNGASVYTDGGITHLSGTIQPYKTFVLVNGQTVTSGTSPACSPELQLLADQLDGEYPAPTYMNGNDAISLFKTPGGATPNGSNTTAVDLIGQIGLGSAISSETGWSYIKDSTLTYNDAGGNPVTGRVVNYIVKAKADDGITYGPFWMSWTSDHSLIRKPNVTSGVVTIPSPFKVSVQWDTLPARIDTGGNFIYKDIWDHLGSHVCIADPNAVIDFESPSQLKIYPNPVNSGRFTVNSLMLIKEIKLFNIIGQTVYNKSFSTARKEVEVYTDQLNKGVYIVKVLYSNNHSAIQRILVK